MKELLARIAAQILTNKGVSTWLIVAALAALAAAFPALWAVLFEAAQQVQERLGAR